MWTPIDIFFILWTCNFSPCQEARLNVSEVIRAKENKIIRESVSLRYPEAGKSYYYYNNLTSFERKALSWDKNILVYNNGFEFIYEIDSTK